MANRVGRVTVVAFESGDAGLQRRRQGHRADVRQGFADLEDVQPAERVRRRDAGQLTSAQPPDGAGRPPHARAALDRLPHLQFETVDVVWHEFVVLTQQRHRVRRPHQQLRDIAARPQRLGKALGGRSLVAQVTQVPRAVAEALAHASEGLQPGVRHRCLGQPVEHGRQERALDRRPAGDSGRQCVDVGECTLRVGESQRLQSLPGGLRRQAQALRRDGGYSFEQWTVEELLVQAANDPAMGLPFLLEIVGWVVAIAHAAPEPAQRFGIVGHQVGPAQPEQLDAVLQRPKELVGVFECDAVPSPDVAVLRQRSESDQRRRTSQRLIATAVDQLE